LILILPIILFLLLYYPIRGAMVDDTYIHLQYARNLATLHELSFNPGEATYGATSPLWVFMLSLVHVFNLNPVVACRVLSVVLAIASIVLFYNFVFRITADRSTSLLCAVILATEAWFVRWSSVGMETSLAVFMIILAMNTLLKADRSTGNSLLNGFVLFLAVLARPELILVFFIFAVSKFVTTGRKGLRFSGALLFVVLYTGWLFIVHRHTGTFFPLTAGAKQGRISLDTALMLRAAVPVKIVGATLLLPLLSVVISLVLGVARTGLLSFFDPGTQPGIDKDELSTFLTFAVMMIFALPAAYVIMNFQLISRYLVPIVPLVIVMGVLGFRNIVARAVGRVSLRRAILVVFSVLVVVQSILFYYIVVVPPTKAFAEGLDEVLVSMGTWLKENTPESTVVALPDIGAVGYYSRRRVLDLGGLVSPEINRIRRTVDYEEMLERGIYLRFHPDYLIDRSRIPERFAGRIIANKRFVPVLKGEIAALGIRKKGPFTYVLYRIEDVP